MLRIIEHRRKAEQGVRNSSVASRKDGEKSRLATCKGRVQDEACKRVLEVGQVGVCDG